MILTSQLDKNEPRVRARFRAGFRALDHLHTITVLTERANEYSLSLIRSIDYQKAFDIHKKVAIETVGFIIGTHKINKKCEINNIYEMRHTTFRET